MKFLCERNALKDALHVVIGRTKGYAAAIPILSHILVEAKDNTIKLTGHNLDCSSQVTIPAEVTADGDIAIPGDRFSKLVAGLATGSQITLSAEDNLAKIKCGRSNYQLALLPACDFPPALSPVDPVTLTLTAKECLRLFAMPAACISEEQSRFYLCGIYLHCVDKRLAACATDGHTLLRTFVDLKPPAFDGVIVPEKSCPEIARIAADGDVKFEITKTLIAVEAGNRRFVSKLIDGTYPDYLRVIPSPTAAAMTVDAPEFDAALGRLIVACDPDKAPVVLLRWNESVEHIAASLSTTFGKGDEQIDVDCKGRDAGEVAAQVSFLRKLVDAMGCKRVRLLIDGPGDPIRIENPDDKDTVAVCMPCRI